jgi:hypothetical protein
MYSSSLLVTVLDVQERPRSAVAFAARCPATGASAANNAAAGAAAATAAQPKLVAHTSRA